VSDGIAVNASGAPIGPERFKCIGMKARAACRVDFFRQDWATMPQAWSTTMTTPEVQLSKVAQTRINRLAKLAGRSPAAMLRFVLRDGFEAVELSIQENAVADAQFAAGNTVAQAQVMYEALTAVRGAQSEARAAA
jgi:hypothetical protein